MAIPFDRNFDAPYGENVQVSPLIHRVLAPNPGPFTFRGTGVYIVGTHEVAVIDPGPAIPAHIEALKRALDGKHLSHILVTHTHSDHSPAAQPLKEWSGARTYAFGAHGSGKAEEGVKVEEGGDRTFVPDVVVRDGDTIAGADYTIDCVYTPGHTSNHMCFALQEEEALFTGDHVMGWSTSVVAPPDGDMAAYMASLRKLQGRNDEILWPTHGGPVRDPGPFLESLYRTSPRARSPDRGEPRGRHRDNSRNRRASLRRCRQPPASGRGAFRARASDPDDSGRPRGGPRRWRECALQAGALTRQMNSLHVE